MHLSQMAGRSLGPPQSGLERGDREDVRRLDVWMLAVVDLVDAGSGQGDAERSPSLGKKEPRARDFACAPEVTSVGRDQDVASLARPDRHVPWREIGDIAFSSVAIPDQKREDVLTAEQFDPRKPEDRAALSRARAKHQKIPMLAGVGGDLFANSQLKLPVSTGGQPLTLRMI
jgi:hypothetical protein